MCLGIPGQIVEVGRERPDLATVDIAGVRREIDVSLLVDDPVEPGEWVLVHVGFALSRIDADEARRERERVAGTLARLRGMRQGGALGGSLREAIEGGRD